MAGSKERLSPSAAVTTVGLDHVRLVYDYLETGDADGYRSLLDEQAQVRAVGNEGDGSRHELHKIIAEGDSVVVTGRCSAPSDEFDFADVFTLSELGLLLSHRRFRATDE
jgi:hypothetical protein